MITAKQLCRPCAPKDAGKTSSIAIKPVMRESYCKRSVWRIFIVEISGFEWLLCFFVCCFLGGGGVPGLKHRGDKLFFSVTRPQHLQLVALHGNVN